MRNLFRKQQPCLMYRELSGNQPVSFEWNEDSILKTEHTPTFSVQKRYACSRAFQDTSSWLPNIRACVGLRRIKREAGRNHPNPDPNPNPDPDPKSNSDPNPQSCDPLLLIPNDRPCGLNHSNPECLQCGVWFDHAKLWWAVWAELVIRILYETDDPNDPDPGKGPQMTT